MFRFRTTIACALLSFCLSLGLAGSPGASFEFGGYSARAGTAVNHGNRDFAEAEDLGVFGADRLGLDSRTTSRNSGITVRSATLVAGGTLTALVENIPAPSVGVESAGATVSVVIGGWVVGNPKLEWSVEDQAWKFKYELPSESASAPFTLTVVHNTGSISSASGTIAP